MLRLAAIAVALSTLTLAAENFTIDAAAIDDGTKSTWCTGELNTCQTLCGNNNIGANACTPKTLDYNCTCADGSVPPLDDYTQSMPWYICEQAFEDCTNSNVGNATALSDCATNIQDECGTKAPALIVSAATTSASAAASTAAATSSSAPSSTVKSASTSTGGAAPTNLAYLGNGAAVVAAGLFAALL